MSTKPNAAKAGSRTPGNEKAPGVRGARGQKKAASKQRNFTTGHQNRQSAKPQPANTNIPLAAELYELLHRHAATVADAPPETLVDHPTVTSWHTVSGGFGRLSDQVHALKAWLRSTRSEFFVTTTGIRVRSSGREGIVKAYSLKWGISISDGRQLGLFPEGGEQ